MNGTNSNTSGNAVASVDYAKKGANDCILDEVMEELVRRLIVTLEVLGEGNVVFSPEPPDDKSKVWWQTDATTNIPIGQPKVWNDETQQWIPAVTSDVFIPPRRRFGRVFAPPGATSQNFSFEDIGTEDYFSTITPTTFDGTTWGAAPGTFPTHFGWCVTGKTTNTLTLSFFGTPSPGIWFEVDIEERVKTS